MILTAKDFMILVILSIMISCAVFYLVIRARHTDYLFGNLSGEYLYTE